MSQSSPSGGAKKLGLPVEKVGFEGSFVPERKYQVATIPRITRSSSSTNERSLVSFSHSFSLSFTLRATLRLETGVCCHTGYPLTLPAVRHLEGTSCSYEEQRQKAERSLSRVTKGVLTKRYIHMYTWAGCSHIAGNARTCRVKSSMSAYV